MPRSLLLPVLLTLALVLAVCTGCVRRRLTICSQPAGALAYVDDQEIGTTPVSTSYTYYGTRKIRLVRDGYETLTVLERFRPPWYQFPPLDFVSENLWPGRLRDERIVQFQLIPKQVVPRQQLLSRAEDLRKGSREGYVAPLPTGRPVEPAGPAPQTPPAAPGGEDTYNPHLTFPPPPPPQD